MSEKMGIIGRKLGMTRIFADDGSAVAVTVVKAGPCPVTQVKTVENDGYNVAIVAASSRWGNYFRGAPGSTLYIDELQLIYRKEE